jgi:nitrate/nitrite-specific signal transduction histidine kinase
MNSVHQDDRDIVREVIDEALKGIRPYDVDYRILLPDGTLRFVHAQAEIVHDESGKPLRMSGTVQDITLQKITEKELTKLAHDLGERVKEQKCLYNISKLDEKPGISLDEIFQGVVDTIPPGWHYPDITCARIIYSGKKYKTANFQETDWKQTSGIHVQGVRIGSLTVGYLEQRPELDEGPFLKEERELIDTIAKNLGRTIERKLAQVELQKNKDNLEKTVKKRTSELEAVNEELKVNLQDIETFNKLAVGREKKMIVLKKEINELLKELGRDKKYKTTRNNRNGTQGNQRHVH